LDEANTSKPHSSQAGNCPILSAQFLADLSRRDSTSCRDNVACDFLLCRFSRFIRSGPRCCSASHLVAPREAAL